jgi:type VI secretion system protein ImpF
VARNDSQIRITPSVLDRLIDYDPRETREPPKSRSATLQELKSAVRRDLEWLLNTRTVLDPDELDAQEIKRSVAVYGLPDITGLSAQNKNEQARVLRAVEHAIHVFEPRFLNLKVTMEPPTQTERSISFRIEAQLDVDPVPEPIVFDTVLKLGSSDFSVKET